MPHSIHSNGPNPSATLMESRNDHTIPVLKVFMPESAMGRLRDVMLSGYIAEGPQAKAFEEHLARWLNAPNVLTLNCGTSALHLALRLAGVGPGDEVITTPMTCVGANEPIVTLGARIRWADIDPNTGNIDPEDVQRKINAKTRAIMVMHWGGYPCELAAIHALADAHGVKVIEDACHAFGSRYDGRLIGSHSDFVCFSFQAVKMMTTGDGGALVCKDPDDAQRGRLLRWYGLDRRLDSHLRRRRQFFEQDIREVGYKFHMNDIAATIGLEQLKYVNGNLAKYRENAARYDTAFQGLRHARRLDDDPRHLSNHWLYTLRVSEREGFTRAMQARGIDASPIHVRNDLYTIFKEFRTHLPGVDAFDPEHVCIPVGWWLNGENVEHIIRAVWEWDALAG